MADFWKLAESGKLIAEEGENWGGWSGLLRACTHKSRLFGNRWLNVRLTPISGHRPTRRACPLSARNGLIYRAKHGAYSITSFTSFTSSARARSVGGTSRPSALAVLNRSPARIWSVAEQAGRHVLMPRRMRPTCGRLFRDKGPHSLALQLRQTTISTKPRAASPGAPNATPALVRRVPVRCTVSPADTARAMVDTRL